MRTQLSTLAKQLHKAVNLVRPQEQTSKQKQQRVAFFDRVVGAAVMIVAPTGGARYDFVGRDQYPAGFNCWSLVPWPCVLHLHYVVTHASVVAK